MKISRKKETELYDLLYNEIMDARVKIGMKLEGSVKEAVDDIMGDLTMKLPQKAIELFNIPVSIPMNKEGN
jgi:hypothetical protein